MSLEEVEASGNCTFLNSCV